jgi:hypothetical protein
MKAKTISGKSTVEIQSALEQCLSDGYSPTLAIVFMSFAQDIEGVCELLHGHDIQVFGSTSSGEFISSEIIEKGIVIMLLDIPPDRFRIYFYETEGNTYEKAKHLGAQGKALFGSPAFILASGWLHIDGEQIIKGVEDGFGGEVPIFGGMAGDDQTLTGPKVFTHGEVSTTGLVALVLDHDKIEVNGIATCGWKPVGIAKTITKSEGNIVYTIDERPALDTVIKYLGLTIGDQPITNTVFNLGAYYPLQLERADAPSVMRTAMLGNTEDRSLICAGTVPQGSKVRFSLPPDFDVIDTVVNECEALKDETYDEADAVIMFSCVSRYLSFGVMTEEEIRRVLEVWNAPFIGFFTYGEFGKSKRGKHEFHNNTCCVVTLKEKKQVK